MQPVSRDREALTPDLRAQLQSALDNAYTLERELGGGGMSRLFHATETSLNRAVVVKVLPPEFTSEVSAARFKQEIGLAAHLQHPNILPVLNVGVREGLLYYVMPYVPGESLRHRLTNEGKLPVGDALRILHEIADALAYAHAEGVIHRDIKPENILLEGRHAVLTDFGVARALVEARSGERLTATGLAVGTPGYMSPEQAAGGRDVDARADLYALGVVGYEMLTGAPPFTGPTAQGVLAAQLTTTPAPLGTLRPETPPAAAEAIARALAGNYLERMRTAAEFRDALGGTAESQVHGPPAPRQRRGRLLAGGAALAIVAAAGLWYAVGPPGASTLEPNLLAVAPFDALTPDLALWREGLVDILSRNLDGAGPLRTVPPSIVVQHWSGRADPPSAATLGRRTSARLAVFGQLVPTRADSVRVTATLFDVAGGHPIGEMEYRDLSSNMDRLADSLTVGILSELGRSRPIGAVRATTLRSSSVGALRAFLQGEQYFRSAIWDSALASYQRAVTLDSGFALAWRKLGLVVGWRTIGGDSLSVVYALRAVALNHGLPPRDSLLLTVDSMAAALFANSADTAWRAHQARLFSTLEEVTRRFPEDPEAWFHLGDARIHFQQVGRTALEDVLAPFDRAIALDSAVGEFYIHPVYLALRLGRPEVAQRYIAGFLARHPTDANAASLRLAGRVLAEPGADLGPLITNADASVLATGIFSLSQWPDSQESGSQLGRALVSSRSDIASFNDPRFRRRWAAKTLAYRGHLKESYAIGGDSLAPAGDIAALGGVPADHAAAFFRRWLEDPPLRAESDAIPYGFNLDVFVALPWWAARGDTASLASFGRQLSSLAGGMSPRDQRPWLAYGAGAARGYLALVRGDTAEALRQFTSLPDTVCPCVFDQIVESQLLLARGRTREAAAVFHNTFAPVLSSAEGLWRLQRARAFERLGQRDQAVEDYRFVVDVWRRADPELQPYVSEARDALERLTREPRR